MILRRIVRSILGRVKNWVNDDSPESPATTSPAPIPFDNSYSWLWSTMGRVMLDPVCARRPAYVWGILQGAALSRVLGLKRIIVLEVGVAGGAGLVSMEKTAELCADLVGIEIEVYGFDTGQGLPKPQDYRDNPFKWTEGYYPCDKDDLLHRLNRASLRLGLLRDTVPEFLASSPAPMAFVGIDLGMYSSAMDALKLFEGVHGHLIPRMPCSFRCAVGKDFSEFAGEVLAIREFNAAHSMRKISPIKGLTYYVPPEYRWWWTEQMFTLHVFDHPLYNNPDAYELSAVIDVNDTEVFKKSQMS